MHCRPAQMNAQTRPPLRPPTHLQHLLQLLLRRGHRRLAVGAQHAKQGAGQLLGGEVGKQARARGGGGVGGQQRALRVRAVQVVHDHQALRQLHGAVHQHGHAGDAVQRREDGAVERLKLVALGLEVHRAHRVGHALLAQRDLHPVGDCKGRGGGRRERVAAERAWRRRRRGQAGGAGSQGDLKVAS